MPLVSLLNKFDHIGELYNLLSRTADMQKYIPETGTLLVVGMVLDLPYNQNVNLKLEIL